MDSYDETYMRMRPAIHLNGEITDSSYGTFENVDGKFVKGIHWTFLKLKFSYVNYAICIVGSTYISDIKT